MTAVRYPAVIWSDDEPEEDGVDDAGNDSGVDPDDIEHCDHCGSTLEEGRIGYCDGCMDETGRRSEYDDGDEDEGDL